MAVVPQPVTFASQPMSDMASPASTPASSSSLVPTIDISPFLLNPTSDAANDVCQAIRAACLHTGFFQVIGHAVSTSTLTGGFEASRRFFTLPLEQKQKLDITKQLGFRGYDGLGTQSYSGDTLPDLKEVRLHMNSQPSPPPPFHSNQPLYSQRNNFFFFQIPEFFPRPRHSTLPSRLRSHTHRP